MMAVSLVAEIDDVILVKLSVDLVVVENFDLVISGVFSLLFGEFGSLDGGSGERPSSGLESVDDLREIRE